MATVPYDSQDLMPWGNTGRSATRGVWIVAAAVTLPLIFAVVYTLTH